jgi:uncharacterized membrane protein
MNRSRASLQQKFVGAWALSDSTRRSLAKTISWRITGSSATFAISYAVLGDINISGTIALIQLTANTLLYFIHERAWDKLRWGRS